MTRLLPFVMLLAWSAPALGQDSAETLRKALSSFESAAAMKDPHGPEARSRFQAARAGFESLIAGGVRNSGLYYNLANAQLRLGDIGRAVLNYRRALRLAPGDERVRKNLESARRICELQIPRPTSKAVFQTLFFWHYDTSLVSRQRAFLVIYGLAWALLTVNLFIRQRVAALVWTIRALMVGAILSGASVAWDEFFSVRGREGVVIAPRAVLHKGNGEYYAPQLNQPLTSGVEFRVIEERDDVQGGKWLQIELWDGKTGWLTAGEIELI